MSFGLCCMKWLKKYGIIVKNNSHFLFIFLNDLLYHIKKDFLKRS